MSMLSKKNPGAAPRQIAANDLRKRLPVRPQLVAAPIFLLVGLIVGIAGSWLAGVGCFAASGLVLILHVTFTRSYYRKLIHYPAVLGRVIGFTNPDDDGTRHLVILHFDFQVEDVVYTGEKTVGTKPDLHIGSPLWVLYNPRRPSDAIPWLE